MMLKGKYIMRKILWTYGFIALLLISGFYVSTMVMNGVEENYHDFVVKNKELTQLPILIEKSEKYFFSYLQNKKEENLLKYEEINKDIQYLFQRIHKDSYENKETLIYYGSLKQMYTYQQESGDKLLALEIYSISDYEEITYLTELFRYMNIQSQHLITAYLSYSSMQYEVLLRSSRQLEGIIFILVLLLAGGSISLGFLFTKDIFRTLKVVSNYANELSQGRWDMEDLPGSKYIELDTVVQAYNRMKRDIKDYIEELKLKSALELKLQAEELEIIEKDRLLKASQLQMLQMQINPHFLFNTFNMIGRLIKLEEPNNAVSLIEAVSEIMRYSLQNKDNKVMLMEELKALQAYLYIQEHRFGDRISFEINQQGDMSNILIPPMILQPLVENCIMHGLKDKVQNGYVHVNLRKDDHVLMIQVEDNGKGMNEQVLESIRQVPNKLDNGIGLTNVIKRLQLQYDCDDILSIPDRRKKGTTVMIEIPLNGE